MFSLCLLKTTLRPIQHYLPKSVRSEREIHITSGEINKLLSKGVLEVTHHSGNKIISDILLRDKKDGSHRMILNLKNLNLYKAKAHFKMDTLHTITNLIKRDCFMASIGLKTFTTLSQSLERIENTSVSFGRVHFFSSHPYLILGTSPACRENSRKFSSLPSPSYTYGVTYRVLTLMICTYKDRPIKNVFIML